MDVKFDKCNRLLVSSDGTSGKGDGIIVITYNGNTGSDGICHKCGDGAFNYLFILIPILGAIAIGIVAAWVIRKKS